MGTYGADGAARILVDHREHLLELIVRDGTHRHPPVPPNRLPKLVKVQLTCGVKQHPSSHPGFTMKNVDKEMVAKKEERRFVGVPEPSLS